TGLRIVPADSSPGTQRGAWTSANRARTWLDSLKTEPEKAGWIAKIWRTQRANLYLVSAIVLLLAALMGWGTHTQTDSQAQSTVAGRRHKNPVAPKLTFFEKALVSLGLAEPPPAPVYMGNPEVQVWEDVHTALYYCPGAELYGKTQ